MHGGFAGVRAAAPAGANDLCVGASRLLCVERCPRRWCRCPLRADLPHRAAVPVPHELSPSPCARRLPTSPLVQVDYASSPVASPRSAVVDSNVHGSLFSVSRTRRVEYAVVRSADGRLCAMHGRLRAGAARLGAWCKSATHGVITAHRRDRCAPHADRHALHRARCRSRGCHATSSSSQVDSAAVQLTSAHCHDRYDRNSDDCRAYLLFATDRESLTPQFHGGST